MPSKAVFITFKSKAGADKALEYDGDQYGKGTLQASKSERFRIQNGSERFRYVQIHYGSTTSMTSMT